LAKQQMALQAELAGVSAVLQRIKLEAIAYNVEAAKKPTAT